MTDPATFNPKAHDLARRLLTHEARGRRPSEAIMPALFRVSEKLRRPLSTLAGTAGFSSLLARALTLAKQEAPTLRAVQVKPDGSLDYLSELQNHVDSDEAAALIAQLLGLLFTFIGEGLTLRLMHDVWPDLSFGQAKSAKETKHDPTR